ncbi:hypothetical protein [Nocardiopsis sp. MG754419]|uniref:hypothetical protein n=1 Tax=Nocardiopsis sp. MG754419 TaxID=2259865 RepID=UPI001BA86F3A|nr:hypothetical protein [Nocardiopsis sp. MG754419]MBR8745325.1 hypothetical protein [Nocardiopsis sp. MG754419]
MSKPKKKPTPETAVDAASVQQAVQAAKTLASIPGQEVLEDAAHNPATRGRYDELTAQRLERELELSHRRRVRAAEEEDRKEGEQAEIERAIAAARKATSPARTVLDMTRHQVRFGRVVLTASIALSIGSAMGLAALVEGMGGPVPVGYLAEIGLTGLSTTVIVWRGILARAGAKVDDNTQKLFAFLVAAPLLVSIVGSSIGSGPVGAACSIGSALFAGLAYLINTSASATIGQAIAKIDATANTKQKAPATPDGPAVTPDGSLSRRRPQPKQSPAESAGIGDQTARWLADFTAASQGVDDATATPDDTDRQGVTDTPDASDVLGLFPDLEGTRWEIRLAIHVYGIDISNRALSKLIRCSRDTIRTHRTALWRDGHKVFDPNKVNDC